MECETTRCVQSESSRKTPRATLCALKLLHLGLSQYQGRMERKNELCLDRLSCRVILLAQVSIQALAEPQRDSSRMHHTVYVLASDKTDETDANILTPRSGPIDAHGQQRQPQRLSRTAIFNSIGHCRPCCRSASEISRTRVGAD